MRKGKSLNSFWNGAICVSLVLVLFSLFFTSCVVMIKWEIVYARHPERFWHESNPKLQCENCREQLCHYKKKRQLMNQLSRILKNKKEEAAR